MHLTFQQASSAPQQAASVHFLLSSTWPFLLTATGNVAGAATNTVGKGVTGITDTTGNVVEGAGKGLGNAVTGITQGLGDTTKGEFLRSECEEGVNGIGGGEGGHIVNWRLICVILAAGNMVGDTTRAGTQSAQNQTGTKQ